MIGAVPGAHRPYRPAVRPAASVGSGIGLSVITGRRGFRRGGSSGTREGRIGLTRGIGIGPGIQFRPTRVIARDRRVHRPAFRPQHREGLPAGLRVPDIVLRPVHRLGRFYSAVRVSTRARARVDIDSAAV